MAPKPFPYPIGVGVDICHIPRLYNLVGKPSHYVSRWAKKIFTSLEWPYLWRKFYEISNLRTPSEISKVQLWIPEVERTMTQTQRTHHASSAAEATHSLPNDTAHNLACDGHADASPLLPSLPVPTHHAKLLAQHLAGRYVPLFLDLAPYNTTERIRRWAAKEAAIKAHRNRRLSLNDISIVQDHSESSANKPKLHALIAPENKTKVVMNSQVAKLRGLLERQPRFPHVYGDVLDGQFVRMPAPTTHNMLPAEMGRKFWVRGPRIKDEERQIAEINISHDHDYAVAVCMALDEKATPRGSVDYIVDDGFGESIHEPEWGDEGWLDDSPAMLGSGR
ncbi:MAG: hypothetical protein Q9211_005529 [Gyalolechia sp. 1 TL-2023]